MSILKRLTDSESDFLLGLIADTPPPAPSAQTPDDRPGEQDSVLQTWSNPPPWASWYNFANR
jgi:hypothetical protein